MLSDFLRRKFGSFGRRFLNFLASSDITPNQITYIGLALVCANCGLYLVHGDLFWLGVGVALSYTFDSLDGVIARRQHKVSKFGGYLDAIVDRYQEIITYLVIAWMNNYWPVVFFVVTGSLLTSYNKARTALEISVDNNAWPDLLDRPRRSWLLCAALIMDAVIPIPALLGGQLLYLILVVLAVLTHFTAVQRFFRARRMLLPSYEMKTHISQI